MAQPILLKLPPSDPREALFRRLENAPHDHVEALLALYDVVQGLHDRGVLELLKGAVGSGEKILEILVAAGDTPEVIRAVRNFIVLTQIAGTMPTEQLETLQRAIVNGVVEVESKKPPGLLQLVRQANSEDTRRAVSFLTGVLQAFGKSLECKPKPGPPGA